MARKAQNAPILLHPEQETGQKLPFERLEGEPAQWYLRFRAYAMMGRGRSLQATLAQEKGLLQTEDEDNEVLRGAESENISTDGTSRSRDEQHFLEGVQRDQERQASQDRIIQMKGQDLGIVVPGAWKRASVKWRWVRRAEAYDEQVRGDIEQELLRYLHHEALYITKAQRLSALDLLGSSLMTALAKYKFKDVSNADDFKLYLSFVKATQSVLKDIRKEMSSIDLALVRRETSS